MEIYLFREVRVPSLQNVFVEEEFVKVEAILTDRLRLAAEAVLEMSTKSAGKDAPQLKLHVAQSKCEDFWIGRASKELVDPIPNVPLIHSYSQLQSTLVKRASDKVTMLIDIFHIWEAFECGPEVWLIHRL